MDSLNRLAIELVDEALEYAEMLSIAAHEIGDGSTVIDFGVDCDGGLEAGLLLSEIQTAGLATPAIELTTVGEATIPAVELSTDQPALSLLCAQKAGWEVATEDFEGLGSGPARALVAEEFVFEQVGYADHFDLTALAIESDELPTEAVARQVAAMTGVEPEGVFLLTYPAASLVGSVVGAARAAELAVVQLAELGYDPRDVVAATGSAPVAPVADDEWSAIARTNDAIAYGGRAHLVVREDLDFAAAVPSSAGERGVPFAEIFAEHDWSFEDVPADLFAPATVTIDVAGGPTYVAGETDESVLIDAFEL